MPRVVNKNGLVAVLDIGSSKTCCLIARPLENEKVELVGFGSYQSRGVEKGEITDLKAATQSVLNAVAEAEKQTGERIDVVVASAAAKQLSSKLISESQPLDGKEASQNDISRLIAKAQSKITDKNIDVLHCLAIDYGVDDRHGVTDPTGLSGDSLSLIMHAVTTPRYPMRDMDSVLSQSHLTCVKKVAPPYAAGLACLTREESEQGSVVIDLGAESTGIGYFFGGQFVFCDRLPVGANSITQDLTTEFKISRTEAERIKTLNGSALPSASFSQEEIVCSLIGEENNANSTRIPKSAVVTVIEKRVVEIFTAVRARLEQQDLYAYCLNAVLVGGGAQLHGICEKAGSVLELPVRRGKPQHIPLRQTVVPEHMYPMATGCFGLLRYTSRYLLNKAFLQDDVGKPKNKFVRLFQWFLDNC